MSSVQTDSNDAKVIISSWVNEYTDDLYAYAVKRVSDDNLAKDLVQNTFLAAYQSYSKFEHKSKPKTWLTSILKNKVMDHFRQVYRRNETFIEGQESSYDENGNWKENQVPEPWTAKNVLDNPNFVSVFDQCIDNLPEKWASSVRIKYLEADMDIEELGITKANYWKMLERARTQLRGCLEEHWFKLDK